jgi:hypothetical protein
MRLHPARRRRRRRWRAGPAAGAWGGGRARGASCSRVLVGYFGTLLGSLGIQSCGDILGPCWVLWASRAVAQQNGPRADAAAMGAAGAAWRRASRSANGRTLKSGGAAGSHVRGGGGWPRRPGPRPRLKALRALQRLAGPGRAGSHHSGDRPARLPCGAPRRSLPARKQPHSAGTRPLGGFLPASQQLPPSCSIIASTQSPSSISSVSGVSSDLIGSPSNTSLGGGGGVGVGGLGGGVGWGPMGNMKRAISRVPAASPPRLGGAALKHLIAAPSRRRGPGCGARHRGAGQGPGRPPPQPRGPSRCANPPQPKA